MPEDLLLISGAAAQMLPLLWKYTRNNIPQDERDPSNIWKQQKQQQQQINSVVDYVKRKDRASTYKTILLKTHDHMYSPNRPYTHDQPMLQAWQSCTKHYNWNQAAATTADRSNKYQKPRSHLQDCKTILQVVDAKQNRVYIPATRWSKIFKSSGRAINSNKKIKDVREA
jgi:hypothetical protein